MRYFITIVCILSSFVCRAQIEINDALPIEDIVSLLEGEGVIIENVEYQFDLDADTLFSPIAFFEDSVGVIGMHQGILITNGAARNALGPNDRSDKDQTNSFDPYNDPDLEQLIDFGQILHDLTIIEFDITVYSDILSFNYVFASEEYPEFLDFNDAFGFFLSGPGINGVENIALVPGTTTPVSVSNINQNVNSQYFIANGIGATPFDNPELQYDGYTTVLKAQKQVNPCETYHIKLAIADVDDSNLDSGVFLEEGSFSSIKMPALSIEFEHERFPYLIEGCNNGTVTITRDNQDLDESVTLELLAYGSADYGLDYDSVPLIIDFQVGQSITTFELNAILDSISDPVEKIIFKLLSNCDKFEQFDILEVEIRERFEMNLPSIEKCGPGAVILNEDPILTDSYHWNYKETLSCFECPSPSTDVLENSNFPFTVYDSISGCEGDGSQFVFYEDIEADFEVILDDCKTSLDIDLINKSRNADIYIWKFGDGTTSPKKDPSHTYRSALNSTEPQEYWLSLTVVDTSTQCKHKKFQRIDISEPFFSPNVITPNNDKINDIFSIKGINEDCWSFYVYNRWGKLVFTESPFQNRFVPTDLNDGQYYYLLKNEKGNRDFNGNFSILR